MLPCEYTDDFELRDPMALSYTSDGGSDAFSSMDSDIAHKRSAVGLPPFGNCPPAATSAARTAVSHVGGAISPLSFGTGPSSGRDIGTNFQAAAAVLHASDMSTGSLTMDREAIVRQIDVALGDGLDGRDGFRTVHSTTALGAATLATVGIRGLQASAASGRTPSVRIGSILAHFQAALGAAFPGFCEAPTGFHVCTASGLPASDLDAGVTVTHTRHAAGVPVLDNVPGCTRDHAVVASGAFAASGPVGAIRVHVDDALGALDDTWEGTITLQLLLALGTRPTEFTGDVAIQSAPASGLGANALDVDTTAFHFEAADGMSLVELTAVIGDHATTACGCAPVSLSALISVHDSQASGLVEA